MAAARIKGVLSPVVTPFKRDLSPDVGRFIAHCKWLLSQDCGLAMFGTNSEANSMSADERMELLDKVVAAGVPTDRMMPGTGACSITSLDDAIERALAYEVDLCITQSHRYGNVALDMLAFDRQTRETGWSFKALVLLEHDRVTYKLWSGEPNVDRLQRKKQPLGPFQEIEGLARTALH